MLGASELSRNEREIAAKLIDALEPAQAVILRRQLSAASVSGRGPGVVELSVRRSCPGSDLRDGAVPPRASVVTEDGDHQGDITLWLASGYLAAIEFGWVTDEVPKTMPPSALMVVEVSDA